LIKLKGKSTSNQRLDVDVVPRIFAALVRCRWHSRNPEETGDHEWHRGRIGKPVVGMSIKG